MASSGLPGACRRYCRNSPSKRRMSCTGTRSMWPRVPAQIATTCSCTGYGLNCGLLEQLDQPRTAGQRPLGHVVQVGPEGGEGLQLAVGGQVETQRAGDRAHRLDLRGATDPGDRDTDVDGRPDAGVEQVALQEALAVGDRDDVGRDVRRDVAGLGLDDRQARSSNRRPARRTASRSAPAGGSAGRRRHPGRPRGPAGGAAAARWRGRPRPAWTGRRR